MKAGVYPAWQLLPGDQVAGGEVADCIGAGPSVVVTLKDGQAFTLPRDLKVRTT